MSIFPKAAALAAVLIATSASAQQTPTPARQIAASAQHIDVIIDASAARAVLAAVRNPSLSPARALEIARMPGNHGLIRKAISYGKPATEASFAAALLATARRQPAIEASGFTFDDVRDRAAATLAALDAFENPANGHVAAVKRRIALMSPTHLRTALTGRIVAGGTSGGFSFGDPEFFLNIDRYPSASLAATIMKHEMFHAVQGAAMRPAKMSSKTEACIKSGGGARLYGTIFAPLLAEGTASYVGDLLDQKEPLDAPARAERDKFQRNVDRVARAVTLLELSTQAMTTSSGVKPEDVYELGFYGDEILYALGYVMARAIAQEQGTKAIPLLLDQRVWRFVNSYTALRGYGASDALPKLGPTTVRWAKSMAQCE